MRRSRSTRLGVALALALAVLPLSGAAAEPVDGPLCATETPPTGAPVVPDDGAVRVASFNGLHGLTQDPPGYPSSSTLNLRTSLAAAQIVAGGIDIVGMQEVSLVEGPQADPAHPLVVAQALAARAAKVSGVAWHWCWYLANPHFPAEPDLQPGGGGPVSDLEAQLVSQFTGAPYDSFKEGLAVLSRYPIADEEGIHLPGRIPAEAALCPLGPDPSSDPATLLGEIVPGGLVDAPLCAATVLFETRAALWARLDTPLGPVDITTTHLAHDITVGSDASSLQQAAVALGFAAAQSARAGGSPAQFLTCDCNAQPGDTVPVVGTIESAGWTDALPGGCPLVCTAGGDVIVTPAPSRAMTERLDYVFAGTATCTTAPSLAVSAPLAPGATLDGVTNTTGGWLWPSDHIGVAATLTACA